MMPNQQDSISGLMDLPRGLLGGIVMGLANLVPGISGGTLLLAIGIYPQFIEALAKTTSLQYERRALLFLISITGAAAFVILMLAGVVKELVVESRWVMYSLFLGSTLGGIPVLLKMIGRPDRKTLMGVVAGLAVMAAMLLASTSQVTAPDENSIPLLFLAGVLAVSAMILPGVSGAYFLVLTGQYVVILQAFASIQTALVQLAGFQQALLNTLQTLTPVALGGILAIAGVSRLVQHLLTRHRSLTLGLLLGLLLGAVLGLWPFMCETDKLDPIVPDATMQAALDQAPPDLTYSTICLPYPTQAAISLGLILGGFFLTLAIGRIGVKPNPHLTTCL